MGKIDILIVDDELIIRQLITTSLLQHGYECRCATNSQETIAEINKKTPNAVILDIWLIGSEIDGLLLLKLIKNKYPLLPIIIISGHGNSELAVQSIKYGAYDYLEKPFTNEKLHILLRRSMEIAALQKENLNLKRLNIREVDIIGTSATILKLRRNIENISVSGIDRILIYGKPGSGKTTIARLIHKQSLEFSRGPLEIFNPDKYSTEEMIDLFNPLISQEVNSASLRKKSVYERCNNGTLFIKHISKLPKEAQVYLANFLHSNKIIVEEQTIQISMRIICGTSIDSKTLITEKNFNMEVLDRINIACLEVPSLSQRKEDLPVIVKNIISDMQGRIIDKITFKEEAITALQVHDWPGNIPQLRNVIEGLLLEANLQQIMDINLEMCMNRISTSQTPTSQTQAFNSSQVNRNQDYHQELDLNIISSSLRKAREIFEKIYLSVQLNRFGSNISKTAQFIGMERSALHRKLKSLNLYCNKKIQEEDEARDNCKPMTSPAILTEVVNKLL